MSDQWFLGAAACASIAITGMGIYFARIWVALVSIGVLLGALAVVGFGWR